MTQPVHGFNGYVAIYRGGQRPKPSELPSWEAQVEVRDVGIVSAWLGRRQAETPVGEVLWVWRRQITMGGKGQPIVRGPCQEPRVYVPGEPVLQQEH